MKSTLHILAYLRALVFLYQTGHWQCAGAAFYGDHLLLQRLYEAVNAEVDAHAERCVQKFGPKSVDPVLQAKMQTSIIEQIVGMEGSAFQRLLTAERGFLAAILRAKRQMEDEGIFTYGWDDYFGGLFSVHEDHMYLLQQRIAEGA